MGYFKWIQDEPNGIMFDDKRHVGGIAQEVMAVLPEVVMDIHDGKYMGVDYASMMPLLIEAVRELDEMFKDGTLTGSEAQEQTSKMLTQLQNMLIMMGADMSSLRERNAMLTAKLDEANQAMAARIAELEEILLGGTGVSSIQKKVNITQK